MLLCYSCIYAFEHIKSNHIRAFIFRYGQVFKLQNLSQVIYIHLYLDIERFLNFKIMEATGPWCPCVLRLVESCLDSRHT